MDNTDLEIVEYRINNLEKKLDLQSKLLDDLHRYLTGIEKDADNLDILIQVTCDAFKITKDELVSHNRSRKYVLPRQIISYIGIVDLEYTTVEVAYRLNRDHSSVVYHRNAFSGLLDLGVKEEIRLYDDIMRRFKTFNALVDE